MGPPVDDLATPIVSSLPIPHPSPEAKPLAPRPPLTAEEQSKLDTLIAEFNEPDFALPTTLKALKHSWKLKAGGSTRSIDSFFRSHVPEDDAEHLQVPLSDVEKCYWSHEAFARCLRATKWNSDAALKRAEETCVWRREFGAETMGEVEEEGETGKQFTVGFDKEMRPVTYMHPYRQNTPTTSRQIDFLVWCLERTIDLLPPSLPPTETICLVIDFGTGSQSSSQPTSLAQAKRVLDILQTYYYERLGRAVVVNASSIFLTFYKLVSPFVDPVTKDKIRFLPEPDATSLIPASQLQSLFGGTIDFQYDHATYSPALTHLCLERKAANLARWREHGEGKCGLSEAVIRGAVVPGEKDGEEVRPAGGIGMEIPTGGLEINGTEEVGAAGTVLSEIP